MSGRENEKKRQTQNRYLERLLGDQILVVFLDGKAAQGSLGGFDQYTLFLVRDDGVEVGVFKHAVKYLHRVSPRS
jgi:sRNA-binding regulator protein Hfq